MSFCQKREIKCFCGKEFEWELWDSINVTTDPDLKDVILNGQMNVVVCPFCGVLFYYEKFLLYHDEKKRYLFYVYEHNCKEDKTKLKEKANCDYETVKKQSNNTVFTNYKVEVFFGLDELIQFLNEKE
ncbi:MAG: CpXC domain-containing protein [Elusimicrobiota bacterium]